MFRSHVHVRLCVDVSPPRVHSAHTRTPTPLLPKFPLQIPPPPLSVTVEHGVLRRNTEASAPNFESMGLHEELLRGVYCEWPRPDRSCVPTMPRQHCQAVSSPAPIPP